MNLFPGLLLRKAFIYFTRIRQTREKYHGGLRQMAEHMHVVTRTLSTEPTPVPTPVATPSIKRPLSGSESAPTIATKTRYVRNGDKQITIHSPESIAMDMFKPSTHTMTRGDSEIGSLTTQLDARRISRMQNFLNNQD